MEEKRFTTSLIILLVVIAVEIYIGVHGYRVAKTFKSRRDAVFFSVALYGLLLWVLRGVWRYGVFGALFDPRNWFLGMPSTWFIVASLRSTEDSSVTTSP